MEFDIDEDLIDDACELQLDNHGGAEELFPDDPEFASEPGTFQHAVAQQSTKVAATASIGTSQRGSVVHATRTPRCLDAVTPAPGTVSQVNTGQV